MEGDRQAGFPLNNSFLRLLLSTFAKEMFSIAINSTNVSFILAFMGLVIIQFLFTKLRIDPFTFLLACHFRYLTFLSSFCFSSSLQSSFAASESVLMHDMVDQIADFALLSWNNLLANVILSLFTARQLPLVLPNKGNQSLFMRNFPITLILLRDSLCSVSSPHSTSLPPPLGPEST